MKYRSQRDIDGGLAVIDSTALMNRAKKTKIAVPAFNIPYIPMTKWIIQAVVDENSCALIEVSRIDWEKFEAQSLEAVAEEFNSYADFSHVRLHLDHVPVLDEEGKRIDYIPLIERAIESGYQSVMIDGSRLPFRENIGATSQIVEIAHKAKIPCEAELGAVLGHESGPLLSYEELYRTGRGFTNPEEAQIFVSESGCDWLSVAIGNIHGAVSAAQRDEKKVEARLNLDHLAKLSISTGIPLVLHGGSGIREEDVRQAFANGITKINVGTEIRQAYEVALADTNSEKKAGEALYERVRCLIREIYRLSDTGKTLGL
jgi:ketose-bisphosphate aldolase